MPYKNPEDRKAYAQIYREKNRDKINEQRAQWREDNRDKEKERYKTYYEENRKKLKKRNNK